MRPRGKVRSPWFVVAISVLTGGIYFIWWQYQTFKDMKDHSGVGIGGWLGLAYAIISLGIVNLFLMPAEVGNLYSSFNQEEPVTVLDGLWNLLPGVGTVIWIVKVQGALNLYWTQLGIDA